MILLNAATGSETTALTETRAIAEEVRQDIAQLTPNVVLETMRSWVPGLMAFGYRLLVAGLILFIGFRIGKMLRRMLGRTFQRMELEATLSKFLTSAVYVMVCGLTVFAAADKIGISSASIVAVLGSAGLALGLALQGSLSNFSGGILILVMKPFKIGDYILCEGMEGTVSSIGLVYTTLDTLDNKQVIMPNGTLSSSVLTNVTAQERRRLQIKVGISYESDLKKARQLLHQLFETHPMMMTEEPVVSFVDELAESSVIIGARGWVATGDYWAAKWDLTEKIKLTFDEEGIEIPYNQMDLHIRSEQGAQIPASNSVTKTEKRE